MKLRIARKVWSDEHANRRRTWERAKSRMLRWYQLAVRLRDQRMLAHRAEAIRGRDAARGAE